MKSSTSCSMTHDPNNQVNKYFFTARFFFTWPTIHGEKSNIWKNLGIPSLKLTWPLNKGLHRKVVAQPSISGTKVLQGNYITRQACKQWNSNKLLMLASASSNTTMASGSVFLSQERPGISDVFFNGFHMEQTHYHYSCGLHTFGWVHTDNIVSVC